MMRAYEFSSIVDKEGKIYIPQQYLSNITSPVRVILLSSEKKSSSGNKQFSAMRLETKEFKFNREEANER